MSKNVFIVGITGYVGGSVFTALKAAHPEFTYTALARKEGQFPAIIAAGATTILGSSTDQDVIAQAAYEADIVINCGLDDVGLIKAIIEGSRKRKYEGKSTGVLVHTSGTMVFVDKTKEGKFVEGTRPRNDGNIDDIKAINENDIHGPVDIPILEASLAKDVHSYIIAPSAIHGEGTGPIGRTSAFMHYISNAYQSAGRVFVIGEGTNVIGTVHISDVVNLFLLVIKHALSFYPLAPPTSPYERYYIANTRHEPYKVIAAHFATALYKLGKIPTAEVARITFEEAGSNALTYASNSFTKEERGPALGWVRTGATLPETIEDDIIAAYT